MNRPTLRPLPATALLSADFHRKARGSITGRTTLSQFKVSVE
jgi:hypothetical protein